MSRRVMLLLCILASALMVGGIAPGQKFQAEPAQDQSPKDQSQPSQDQSQSDQQQKKKKKGSFFGGFKAITGQSSQQTSATASAGTKGVGEGKKMAETTPTAADIAAVSAMEQYSVPEKDLKKFQQDGHLQPNQ